MSLLKYDDFENKPLPELCERIKVKQFPKRTRRLRALLLCASILLIIGLLSPVMTLRKFITHNTFSILSGVIALLKDGQIFLFIIITCFSLVLPILKLYVLHRILWKTTDEKTKKYLHLMHLYGRWSMLDVFIVAVLVVSVKLSILASVEMRFGLYVFCAAVLLTMYITERAVKLLKE